MLEKKMASNKDILNIALKNALLHSFNSLTKAILHNESFDDDNCCMDVDSDVTIMHVMEKLQEMNQSLAEIKIRLDTLETKNTRNISPWPFRNEIFAVSPFGDSVDELFEPPPIPLRSPSQCRSEYDKPERVVSEPELLPHANVIDTNEPDIVDDAAEEEEEEEAAEEEVAEEEEEAAEEEAAEEEAAEEEEEAAEEEEQEAAEEEEEEEEAEEEEAEIEEFEYNGKTYYRDDECLVYVLDADGTLNDTPVGRWYESQQKIKFFKQS
jgi:type IV secretory pathway VirB10-like protein